MRMFKTTTNRMHDAASHICDTAGNRQSEQTCLITLPGTSTWRPTAFDARLQSANLMDADQHGNTVNVTGVINENS